MHLKVEVGRMVLELSALYREPDDLAKRPVKLWTSAARAGGSNQLLGTIALTVLSHQFRFTVPGVDIPRLAWPPLPYR